MTLRLISAPVCVVVIEDQPKDKDTLSKFVNKGHKFLPMHVMGAFCTILYHTVCNLSGLLKQEVILKSGIT